MLLYICTLKLTKKNLKQNYKKEHGSKWIHHKQKATHNFPPLRYPESARQLSYSCFIPDLTSSIGDRPIRTELQRTVMDLPLMNIPPLTLRLYHKVRL